MEILHHPIPASRTVWSCIYVKCNDCRYFEPPQVNIGDDAAEKFYMLCYVIIALIWHVIALYKNIHSN